MTCPGITSGNRFDRNDIRRSKNMAGKVTRSAVILLYAWLLDILSSLLGDIDTVLKHLFCEL